MEKAMRKPKDHSPRKKTVNHGIANHGLTEQLLEIEYQKQKLEQSAYEIQLALGMSVEPVETISLGYDIELHGFKIAVGRVMEVFRQLDEYICGEEPVEIPEDTRRTRESIRKYMLEQIGEIMHLASHQTNVLKRKYQKEN